jgi:hypothetical protein
MPALHDKELIAPDAREAGRAVHAEAVAKMAVAATEVPAGADFLADLFDMPPPSDQHACAFQLNETSAATRARNTSGHSAERLEIL